MSDGEEVWSHTYPAIGRLDYGNSPRATPLIIGDRVVLQGAFGDLSCLDLNSGEIHWQINYPIEFGSELPTWGFCGSPLLVRHQGKNMIVVQPGAEDASLVALDLTDGTPLWQTDGRTPSYSSLILAEIGGDQQIIGYDAKALCGWDLKGALLWEYQPERDGDFNVPTPIMIDQQLFLTTENNGSRLFRFDDQRRLIPEPVHSFELLAPDTHTPVVAGDLICGACAGLFCLQKNDLKLVHQLDDESLEEYASIVTDGANKLLLVTLYGEVILANVDSGSIRVAGRMQLGGDEAEIMAHPAFVGPTMIVRLGRQLVRIDLD